MPLSVEGLLSEPGLGLELLVAGQLDREVRWVQVSELTTSGPPYLRAGDVILNDESWIRETHPTSFIRCLVRADAAALGCGLRSGVDEVDPALIRACRSAGLTLFAVPPETAFVTVVERFVELLRQDREGWLVDTIDRSTRLVKALGTGASGALRVLAVLRAELQMDVWLVDHVGRIVAPGENVRSLPAEGLQGQRPSSVPSTASSLGLEAVPVGSTSGRTWLLIDASDRSDHDAIIVQTVPFLASALARERAELEAERRYASELVDLILAGQERSATARLDALGFDLGQPFLAIEVRWSLDDAFEQLRRALERLALDAVVATQGARHTALAQDRHGRPLDKLGRALHELLGIGCAVGVGGAATDVESVRRSIVEAREAVALAATPGPGWATADSLCTHRVLLELKDRDVLDSFAESLIGPIVRQDQARQSDLLRTLTTFLQSNGHVKATAQALHIHVNTLRHRLARCEELTGRDLSKMEDRVDFFLALRSQNGGAPADVVDLPSTGR